MTTNSEDKADFLLITALEEERDSVLRKLPQPRRVPPSPDDVRIYFVSDLPSAASDGTKACYRVVLMPLLGMGRVEAAVATGDALRRWAPDYVILVGIAGGVKQAGVKLGDLAVSDQVVDYELQKISDSVEVRYQVHRADSRLLGAAKNLSGSRWHTTANRRPRSGSPKRRIGPIGTGDKVVAKGEFLSRLRKDWPKLLAVEMEAGGVATVCFERPEHPGFFMVRGISDLADEEKNSSIVEKWRQYACDLAASFTIELLKKAPVPFSARAFERRPEARETLPKAGKGRFTVAIARLEHDGRRHVEALIVDALRDLRGVQILRFDRMISLEGAVPEESERKGHQKAHTYLDQSGADVLIWGTVLEHDGRTAPRLFWSTHLASRRSSELYIPRDFKLPQVFWEDLAEVLRVAVFSSAAVLLLFPGRYIADRLEHFTKRLRHLLRARGEKAWSDLEYARMTMLFGHALTLLAMQSGNYLVLDEAITTLRKALEMISQSSNPLEWAATADYLGFAYRLSGEIMPAASRLREAADILNDISNQSQLDRVPALKASIFSNLGAVLFRLGEREESSDSLRRSLRALGAAYRVEVHHGLKGNYVATLNLMGVALKEIGTRELTNAKTRAAIKVNCKALALVHREIEPLNWANVQGNLATALQALGRRERSAELIKEAVAIFEKVLQVHRRDQVPLDWAGAKHNLGSALADLGELTENPLILEEALEVLRESLAERTRDRVPVWWATTQYAIGTSLLALGELRDDVNSIKMAAEAFKLAADEWQQSPRYRLMALQSRVTARRALKTRNVDTADLESDSLLEELLQTDTVSDASKLANQAEAIGEMAVEEKSAEKFERYVQLYRQVLDMVPRNKFPWLWSSAAWHLGQGLRNLGVLNKRAELVCEALRLHVMAWSTAKEVTPDELDWDDAIQVTRYDLETLKGLFQADEYSAVIAENADQLRAMGIDVSIV